MCCTLSDIQHMQNLRTTVDNLDFCFKARALCVCLVQKHRLQDVYAGRLKMHDLKMQDWKMQDWKMTDNILANSEQNYGVWKMQDWKMTDHVN